MQTWTFNSRPLFLVKRHGLYGYVDSQGQWVIRPCYTYAGEFRSGLPQVSMNEADGQFYINSNGDDVFTMRFRSAGSFSEGYAMVETDFGDRGLLHLSSHLTLTPGIDFIRPSSNGYAACTCVEGEKHIWGLIRCHDCRLVIEPSYPFLGDMSEGLLMASLSHNSSEYVFLDTEGNRRSPVFAGANRFSEGVAPVLFRDAWRYLSHAFNPVWKRTFHYARCFSEGLAGVDEDHVRGYINHQCEYVIKTEMEVLGAFVAGSALMVEKELTGGECILIDRQGRTLWRGYGLELSGGEPGDTPYYRDDTAGNTRILVAPSGRITWPPDDARRQLS